MKKQKLPWFAASYPTIPPTCRSSYKLLQRFPTTLLPYTNVLKDKVSHIESPKRKSEWSCSVSAREAVVRPSTAPLAVITATATGELCN